MTDWQRRIDRPGAPAVPILVRRMNGGAGRLFWVTPRNKALAAATYDGRRWTLRALADRVGMSVSGVKDALRSMAAMGIGVLQTARGRLGWTRFRVQDDAVVLKVRPTSDGSNTSVVKPNDVLRTFGAASLVGARYGGVSGD